MNTTDNVIYLKDVFNVIDPLTRFNQYERCARKLMHAGSFCEGLRKYIESENMQDQALKEYVLHALDVLADAYNHAKGEYDKVKVICERRA